MKRTHLTLFLVALALVVWGGGVGAQDPALVLNDGGIQFPDGSVQNVAAVSGFAPVEDTGQQNCWDASGTPISCAGTGQDGELQAGVDWPAPRFTDNLDGTVFDRLTGLTWLQDANCFGLRSWTVALSDANGLAPGGPCGELNDGSVPTDWRLPNVKELSSLTDFGESSPALPSGDPFSMVQPSFYWSSSSDVAAPSFAWDVSLGNGNVDSASKVGSRFVWPVRGGQ
ncbi:MAG: DUF1566 domain-containing protein, partial [Thermoanaerobaculia bacterium]